MTLSLGSPGQHDVADQRGMIPRHLSFVRCRDHVGTHLAHGSASGPFDASDRGARYAAPLETSEERPERRAAQCQPVPPVGW
jgi:hypothetical protein